MKTVLIHWKENEVPERLALLRPLGGEVVAAAPAGPAPLRALSDSTPDVIVIDLSRLPSRGRDVALALRQRRSSRHVPIVFVEGVSEKVETIRRLVPGAHFAEWSGIVGSVRAALAAPIDMTPPSSVFAPYADRPLAAKLGLKANMTVALVDAHDGLIESLDGLPEPLRFVHEPGVRCALTLWWVRSLAELEGAAGRIAEQAAFGPVWIVYPKRTSALRSDITQAGIRDVANALDLVDYKFCGIDATWAGMLLRRRLQ
jgi:CheY-like chemotaxis protein